MKKRLLFATSLLIGCSAIIAQSSLLVTNVSNGNSVIANGAILYKTVVGNGSDQIDINIKNTSSTTKTYKMRMYDDIRHIISSATPTPSDTSNPYFCFGGSCYGANTFISINSQVLNSNDDVVTLNKTINVHYEEATTAGLSSIRYRIYDVSNSASDYTEFTIRYNDPTASIKTSASLFSYVSEVFPNPSNNKASIVIQSSTDVNSATVSITNTLGSIVSSKNIELQLGKNTIGLDLEALNTGIYFATITSGNYKTIKKFTINK